MRPGQLFDRRPGGAADARHELYSHEKRGEPDMLPLFFGFFTVKFFLCLARADPWSDGGDKRMDKKEPAIDIAGLCLPLKPQKEKVRIFFHCSLILLLLACSQTGYYSTTPFYRYGLRYTTISYWV
jgi:hypothetical protein